MKLATGNRFPISWTALNRLGQSAGIFTGFPRSTLVYRIPTSRRGLPIFIDQTMETSPILNLLSSSSGFFCFFKIIYDFKR